MDSLNDVSSPRALLATRRSGKARDMIAPGPDATQLAALIATASRVPDHGKLAPWRFVTVATDRRAALADLLDAAYRAEKPAPGRVEIDAVRAFAFEAPALVIVLSKPVESHIPRWEQQLSAGAVAMQLCNAATAMGFVANWLTGWAAYSPAVHAAIAEPGAAIAGFVFIGTPLRALEERPRPDPATIVRAF
jgi:nitroreductase